eukprot:2134002-Rhodomonas_salina.2
MQPCSEPPTQLCGASMLFEKSGPTPSEVVFSPPSAPLAYLKAQHTTLSHQRNRTKTVPQAQVAWPETHQCIGAGGGWVMVAGHDVSEPPM